MLRAWLAGAKAGTTASAVAFVVAVVIVVGGGGGGSIIVVVGVGAIVVATGRVAGWMKKEQTTSLTGLAPWPYSSPSTASGSGSFACPVPLLQRNKRGKG